MSVSRVRFRNGVRPAAVPSLLQRLPADPDYRPRPSVRLVRTACTTRNTPSPSPMPTTEIFGDGTRISLLPPKPDKARGCSSPSAELWHLSNISVRRRRRSAAPAPPRQTRLLRTIGSGSRLRRFNSTADNPAIVDRLISFLLQPRSAFLPVLIGFRLLPMPTAFDQPCPLRPHWLLRR